MAKTAEQQPVSEASSLGAPPHPRRTRVVIRKLGPLSVLKVSLIFYFCVMLVVLVGLYLLYAISVALGTVDAFVKLLVEFSLVDKGFEVNAGWVFARLFAFGVVAALLWALVNVFAVFLYNLVSDVVGGIEVTLAEKKK